MSIVQLLWFVLIGVLFAGFFFLEGFDFGVGMAVQTLARDDKEKDQIINTIAPVWDGNEVWLITAGGAMFASFPNWYASLFSGFYLILFIILFGLIIRGVSFEFRHKVKHEHMYIWNWTLTIGSLIVPFFFGVLFIDLVQGMPLDINGNMRASFTDYINLFSVVGGVALTLMCYLHGMNYISLKTHGPIRDHARSYAKKLYPVLYVGLVVFAGLVYFKTDFFDQHFILTLSLLAFIVVLTLLAHLAIYKEKELTAFLASGISLVSLVTLLFTGLFPRVMVSSLDGKFDMLIKDASSSPYTLKIMTYAGLTLLPIVLAYSAWSYYIFRKRVTIDSKGY